MTNSRGAKFQFQLNRSTWTAAKALRSRAEALAAASWQRLERKPKYETLTEQRRHRFQDNEKERIVKEREYLNLHLNYEDVAEFDYQPGHCKQPYVDFRTFFSSSGPSMPLSLLDFP